MAMNLLTHPCLLLLWLTSALPPVTSSPDILLPSQDEVLLDLLESTGQDDDVRDRYISYSEQQNPQAADSILLNEAQDEEVPSSSDIDVSAETEEMREFLRMIQQSVLDVEQKKEMLLRRERLYEAGGKRGPSSRFLRIGRSGSSPQKPAGPAMPAKSKPYNVLSSHDSPSEDLSRNLERNRKTNKLVVRGSDEEFRIGQLNDNPTGSDTGNSAYTERESLRPIIGKIWSYFKTPRSSLTLKSRSSAAPGILGSGGRSDFSKASPTSPGQDIPLVRRSYVRIGRLPASVFRQRMRHGQVDLPDDSLEARRSPGFRFTSSGVIRAGKRTM